MKICLTISNIIISYDFKKCYTFMYSVTLKMKRNNKKIYLYIFLFFRSQ